MIVIVYRNVYSGGADTLILRLAKYLSRNDEVHVCTKNIHDSYILNQFKTFHIPYDKSPDYIKIALNYIQKPTDIILCLNPDDFYRIETMSREKRQRCKRILYVVHISALYYSGDSSIRRWASKFILRGMVNSYYKNGNIIFMDEQTLKHSCTFFGLDYTKYNNGFYRIPIESFEVNKEDIRLRAIQKSNIFSILSIARADFPYKGYLKGLIFASGELSKKFGNIELTIVTSREGSKILDNWVCEAQTIYGCKINVLKDIPNDKLTEIYKTASVYVGMGTTLIEAADKAVITYPIALNTYECKTKGDFIYFYDVLAFDSNEGEDIKKHLVRIINLDKKDYELMCLRTKEVCDQEYSMDSFVTKLKTTTIYTENYYVCFVYKSIYLLKEIYHKIKKEGF